MSHRIIISSAVTMSLASDQHSSYADYSFTFTPSHHLSDQAVLKRVGRIRKVLEKLANDVIESGEEISDES